MSFHHVFDLQNEVPEKMANAEVPGSGEHYESQYRQLAELLNIKERERAAVVALNILETIPEAARRSYFGANIDRLCSLRPEVAGPILEVAYRSRVGGLGETISHWLESGYDETATVSAAFARAVPLEAEERRRVVRSLEGLLSQYKGKAGVLMNEVIASVGALGNEEELEELRKQVVGMGRSETAIALQCLVYRLEKKSRIGDDCLRSWYDTAQRQSFDLIALGSSVGEEGEFTDQILPALSYMLLTCAEKAADQILDMVQRAENSNDTEAVVACAGALQEVSIRYCPNKSILSCMQQFSPHP